MIGRLFALAAAGGCTLLACRLGEPYGVPVGLVLFSILLGFLNLARKAPYRPVEGR